jgi:lysophospholipase L1-like esterase
VAAGALALALCLAEAAMRRLRPDLLPSGQLRLQPDARVGWRFLPNQRVTGRTEWGTPLRQRTNALGFADEDHAPEAAAGAARVAFLGDSFTAAVGVDFEDSFVRVAGRELARAAPSRRWETLNFGVPSMGTARERRVWEEDASAFRPAFVVLAFFLGNDLANNMPGYEDTMAGRRESRHRSWFYRAFLEPSLLYQQFKLAQRDLRRALRAGRGRGVSAEDAAKPFWERSYAPLDWQGYLARPEGAVLEAWKTTEAEILALRDEVAADGGRLLVALLPGMEAMMPDEFRRSRSRYPGLEAFEVDPDYPRRRLLGFLGERRVPAVDLAREFEAVPPGSARARLYFRFDRHFSPEGHRLAGVAIARAVAAEAAR